MNKILWKLPAPATAITDGPFLRVLTKRRCEISFSIETESDGEKTIALLFEGVVAFKCTYLAALGSVSLPLLKEAYANLIRVEGSPWFDEVSRARSEYYAPRPMQPKDIQHLMIFFDDGPCYEIICECFNASSVPSDEWRIPRL